MNIEDLKNEIIKILMNVDIEIIKKMDVKSIVDNVSREIKLKNKRLEKIVAEI